MNWKNYLNRIRYASDLNPTLSVLRALQAHHLHAIPFENLDIHMGIPIIPELEAIYQKVVMQNRGGFCYELNGLFANLLKALGFVVKQISARVYMDEKGFGPEFDHLALIVQVEGADYLVDVGFGEFAGAPLRMVLDVEQQDPRGVFMINRYDDTYLQVSKQQEDKWIPEHIFTLETRELGDFAAMCTYQQTASDSYFRTKRMCSLATPTGRISLAGDMLKITDGDTINETTIPNDATYRKYLKAYMGIELEADFITLS